MPRQAMAMAMVERLGVDAMPMTLSAKNVVLAEGFNSCKQSGNDDEDEDEDEAQRDEVEVKVDAGIQA